MTLNKAQTGSGLVFCMLLMSGCAQKEIPPKDVVGTWNATAKCKQYLSAAPRNARPSLLISADGTWQASQLPACFEFFHGENRGVIPSAQGSWRILKQDSEQVLELQSGAGDNKVLMTLFICPSRGKLTLCGEPMGPDSWVEFFEKPMIENQNKPTR